MGNTKEQRFLAIFNHTESKLIVVNDPELNPMLYQEYICEAFKISPNQFHYMTGTKMELRLNL